MKSLTQFITEMISINEAFYKEIVDSSEYALEKLETIRDQFTTDEWYIIEGLTSHKESDDDVIYFPYLIMADDDSMPNSEGMYVVGVHMTVEDKDSKKVHTELKKIGTKAKRDKIVFLPEYVYHPIMSDPKYSSVGIELCGIHIDNIAEILKPIIAIMKKYKIV